MGLASQARPDPGILRIDFKCTPKLCPVCEVVDTYPCVMNIFVYGYCLAAEEEICREADSSAFCTGVAYTGTCAELGEVYSPACFVTKIQCNLPEW
jgi:hypothetical protein